MIKQITTFLVIIFVLVGSTAEGKGKGKSKSSSSKSRSHSRQNNKNNNESINSKETAVISTKFGDIVLEFFDDIAPKHVESFKLHAKNGYYNGTTFHRVIPGFMIQGGDPLTKSEDRSRHGTGGNAAKFFGIGTESNESTWDLPAEFSPTPHVRGILSMARSQNPDSGGSQFFICVADAPFLNNKYTVFGKVVSGLDVVDQIVNVPRDPRDNPNERIEMKVRLNAAVKSASSNQGGGGTFGFILLVLIIAAIVYYRVIYKKAG